MKTNTYLTNNYQIWPSVFCCLTHLNECLVCNKKKIQIPTYDMRIPSKTSLLEMTMKEKMRQCIFHEAPPMQRLQLQHKVSLQARKARLVPS